MEEYEELQDDIQRLDVSVWKKVFKLVVRRKVAVIFLFFFAVALASLDILAPILNSQIIKVFFKENPQYHLKYLYTGLYLLLGVGYMTVVYSFIRLASSLEVSIGYDIRKEAFEKLQNLPFAYYDSTPSGWIMARLTSDSRKLAEIISWGIIDFVWGLFMMVGILIMLFIISWKLALIIAVIVPIMMVICFFFNRIILKEYRNVRQTNSLLTGALNEGFLGAKTTKTLCLEEKRNREFVRSSLRMKQQSIRAVLKSSLFWPIILVLGYIGLAFVLRIGTGFVIGEFVGVVFTVEILYLFAAYATSFFDPVMSVARVLTNLQQAQASAERIIDLINTKETITDSEEVIKKYGTLLDPKKENYEPIEGNILFDNVSFGYTKDQLILKDFTLDVKKGTSVALVGRTGAGKSTIINLLCRFYEPTKGNILIDGVDYKERSIGWLHSSLGYVLQTPYLFNGTIKDNIAYGKKDATMEEIINAAKQAQAYDFIMKMKDGFDTEVGESGNKLSIGQKQLISFARAIIIDPQILILDEATSSIDTQTEVKIKEVSNELMKGRTTFIVAHRLSTIINSDIILVIDGGVIKEKGTHHELLALKGMYYNLYKKQFIQENLNEEVTL